MEHIHEQTDILHTSCKEGYIGLTL